MQIGASTKSFGGMSISETARLLERCGLDVCELCFCHSDLDGWRYNYCGRSTLPCSEDVVRAVRVFFECGITVSAIGVYSCLWSDGTAGLSDSVMQICEYCELARECGVKLIATHTGTLLQPFQRAALSNTVLPLLYDGFAEACTEAAKRGVTVSAEVSAHDLVTSYGGFLGLRGYVREYAGRSDMLKYTLCHASDTDAARIPREDVALFHLKDISADGKYYERFGNGVFDFSPFYEELRCSDAPVILEYVNSGNLMQTVNELREKCGI